MPTVASLEATIDTTLSTLDTAFITNQGTYKGTHPKHFQGILTTDLVNLGDHTDGGIALVQVPVLNRKPTDQTEDWTAFTVAIPGTVVGCIEIHNYGGPQGLGWVLHAYFKHTGRIFRRSINHGAETYHDSAWAQIA